VIENLLTRRPNRFNRNSINWCKMISVRQMKAARALVAWSQSDLSAASGVSEPTIARLESEDGPIGGRAETTNKLIAALEKAGVEFIAENGGGPGVRLRKPQRPGRPK
jgi:DNA-binding XRE family transcriptional regulator